MVQRVTIQDISREAGTSASTVSRVLTGSANVSPAKRTAVEQAVQRLNYRPSHIARSLKTRVTFSVGLMLNDITNSFYGAVARGVEEEAIAHGYSLILCNTGEDAGRELHYLQVLQDKQVDGIILGPTGENAAFICELARRTPLVLVDRRVGCEGIAAVLVDNEAAAYRATCLLIERGYHRIAAVRWQREMETMTGRVAGYRRALTEARIPCDPALEVNVPGMTVPAAVGVIGTLLARQDRPDAIFALNNQIGLGALEAIQQVGLRIPEDVALVVFDDMEFFTLLRPPITAISQPAFDVGREAMRMLIRRMDVPDSYHPEISVLPTRLILRESA